MNIREFLAKYCEGDYDKDIYPSDKAHEIIANLLSEYTLLLIEDCHELADIFIDRLEQAHLLR
jgi:hypothetical protein